MKSKKHILIILVAVLAVSAVIGWGAYSAYAASTDLDDLLENSDDPLADLRAKQQEIYERREELQNQIDNQQTIIEGYSNEIAALEMEMVLILEEKQVIQDMITLIDEQILTAEVEITEAEARLLERRGYLEERLVQLYVNGDITFMDVVFSTETFDDFLVLFDMVETIMAQDRQVLNDITKDLLTIEDNKKLLVVKREELATATLELDDKVADLADIEVQKQTAMQAAESDKAAYAAMLDEEDAVSAQIADMIKEYLREHGDDNLSYGGVMIWPLPAQWDKNWITSPYGGRIHPITNDWRVHTGIDIGADGGTSIYAAADGKVIYSGWLGGYGNTIQILHGDGVSTLYAHMSAYGSFGEGDFVSQGEIIGYVGTTGNSTGNHLHFEVRVDGNHVDPWNYL